MKFYLCFALIFVSIGCLAKEAPTEAEIDLSEPPFWVSSYDEFKDLRSEQKDAYLKKALPLFQQVSVLKDLSAAQLKESADWYPSWDGLRKKVSVFCADEANAKACDQIADVRIQTLENFGNQKDENRSPASADDAKDDSKETADDKP